MAGTKRATFTLHGFYINTSAVLTTFHRVDMCKCVSKRHTLVSHKHLYQFCLSSPHRIRLVFFLISHISNIFPTFILRLLSLQPILLSKSLLGGGSNSSLSFLSRRCLLFIMSPLTGHCRSLHYKRRHGGGILMRWNHQHSQRLRKSNKHTATFPLFSVKPGMFSLIQVDLSKFEKKFDYTG